MALTKRRRIVDLIVARAAEIQTINGYATDAGLRLHLNQLEVSVNDARPLIAVRIGKPSRHGQADRIRYRLPITIVGLTTFDAADPFGSGEALLGDFKRAFFRVDDPDLKGLLIETLSCDDEDVSTKQEGGNTVEVTLVLAAEYMEFYGAPEL